MRLLKDSVFAQGSSRRSSRPAWKTPRRNDGENRPWPDPKVRNGNGGKGGENKRGMDCGIPSDQTGAEHSPAKHSQTPEMGRERKKLSGQNTGTRKVPRGDRPTARGAETPRGVRPSPIARAGQSAPPPLPDTGENAGSAVVPLPRERPRGAMPGEARWIPGRLFPGSRGG